MLTVSGNKSAPILLHKRFPGTPVWRPNFFLSPSFSSHNLPHPSLDRSEAGVGAESGQPQPKTTFRFPPASPFWILIQAARFSCLFPSSLAPETFLCPMPMVGMLRSRDCRKPTRRRPESQSSLFLGPGQHPAGRRIRRPPGRGQPFGCSISQCDSSYWKRFDGGPRCRHGSQSRHDGEDLLVVRTPYSVYSAIFSISYHGYTMQDVAACLPLRSRQTTRDGLAWQFCHFQGFFC